MALFDRFMKGAAWIFFKIFHDITFEGVENVPAQGAVILAANHPSYFDPVYIHIAVKRPVRFLGWEKPFQIPVIGALIRRSGAIPINLDKPGRASFEGALKVLRKGEAFGIFPEGGRSDFGVMNPLKSGVARLAMLTGAPIVPITIKGAFRVWPKYNLLPRPGYVKVIFHPPISLDPAELAPRRLAGERAGDEGPVSNAETVARDRAYEKAIVERVLDAINSSLLPGLRAEVREEHLYRNAVVPWTWTSDAVPMLFLGGFLLWQDLSDRWLNPRLMIWWAVYIIYLALDNALRLPGAWAKGLRARAPWLLLIAMAVVHHGITPAAVFLALLFYGVLTWYSSFRFQSFRRVRVWALFIAYGAWFFMTRSSW